MANKIVLKKSSVAAKVPLATDLEIGELAVNLEDQKLYSKKADGTVVLVGTGVGGGGSGDVVGPASATDNAITRYDGTTGKLIQNSTVTLDDNGTLANVNAISLDTTPTTPPTTAGTVYWDAGNGTPNVVLNADTELQLGQENIAKVYNGSGATIPNGAVVAVVGAQGQRPSVALADADSESTSSNTLGIATESIADGAEGFICTFGLVRGLDTSAFTAGDAIYLSQTAGQFTQTRPSAPAHTVTLGWVIKVNASSGEVFVNISNGWELNELHNVLITTPTGGNLLAYDQTNQYWKNINLTDGTGISVTETTGGAITVTNTAPDQVVSITGAGTSVVTGTYPNFTVTSNDQYTGTVTSVGGTGTVNGITLTGTVTSSGNLTLGGTLSGVDLTTQVTGTLPVLNGGTGATTLTGYVKGTGTSALTASSTIPNTDISGLGTMSTQNSNSVAVTGGTIDGVTIGGSTAAAGTFTSITDSGNLTFTGTGNRITGDFSNATHANRVAFQTSTINGATSPFMLPNGTGDASQLVFSNASDPTNSSYLSVGVFGSISEARINSSILGTGTYLPMTFYTGGSERVRIDTSGNVGIGTSSPGHKLDVNGTARVNGQFTINSNVGFVGAAVSGSGGNWRYLDDTGTSRWLTGILGTAAATNFSIYNIPAGQSAVTIDTSNNVGIGTSSPGVKLDVAGVGRIGNGSLGAYFGTGSAFANEAEVYSISTNPLNIGTAGTAPLRFWTNSSERMRLDSSGNLLVNTTTAGSAGLSIANAKNLSFSESAGESLCTVFRQAGTGDGVFGSGVSRGGSAAGAYISSYSGAWARTAIAVGYGAIKFFTAPINTVAVGSSVTLNEAMRIDIAGNVGIGTSSPSGRLDVETTAVNYTNLSATGAGQAVVLSLVGGTSSEQAICYNATALRFGTVTGKNAAGFTERMRIDSSGNVGIGTTNPLQKLVVSNGGAEGLELSPNAVASGSALVSYNRSGAAYTQLTALALRHVWQNSGSEVMRLDSSGNLLVGTTIAQGRIASWSNNSTLPAARLYLNAASSTATPALFLDKLDNNSTTSQIFLQFTINGQANGSGQINANGAAQAAFGAFSDRRLKTNIVDLEPQLPKIMALRPVEFDYIESEGGGHQISFIAQEFEEVYPDAVGERPDGMKTLTGWGKTEARLVKAIQELKAEFDAYKLSHP